MKRLAIILVSTALLGCASSPSGSGDIDVIERVVLQHTLEELVPSSYPDWTGGHCVGRGTMEGQGTPTDPDAWLLDRMRAEGIDVQPVSTCTLPAQGSPEPTDRATGDQRLLVLLSEPDVQSADHVTFEAQYYAGSMAAAGWECDATRTNGAWNVECRNLWQA